MKKFYLVTLLSVLQFTLTSLAQTVNIIYQGNYSLQEVSSVYNDVFGETNVNLEQATEITTTDGYDIVIINRINVSIFPPSLQNLLVDFVENGGHLVLSTEGCQYTNGEYLASSVWNEVTGQEITETGAGATGTSSPPRFHNSMGPWHSSPDQNLTHSTTSYASFGNMNPLNAIHQRNLQAPSCDNTEAVTAVWPSHPEVGDGTIYMTGEVYYPFNVNISDELENHWTAIVTMQKALMDENADLIADLNSWEANVTSGITDFLPEDQSICGGESFEILNPQEGTSYEWSNGETSQNITITEEGTYSVTVNLEDGCDGIDTITLDYTMVSDFLPEDTTVCFNESGFLIDHDEVGNGYLWNTGETSQDITVFESGDYSIQLSNNGCSFYDTINVQFQYLNNDLLPEDIEVCAYEPISITAEGGNSYTWSTNENGSTISVNNSGTFMVNATLNNGCIASDTIDVLMHPVPGSDFSVENFCAFSSTIFNDLSNINSGTIEEWNWTVSNEQTYTQQNPSHFSSNSGQYSVSLKTISDYGCEDSITKEFLVYPKPEADFLYQNQCINGAPTLFTDISTISIGNINFWQWNINGNTFGNENFSYSYPSAGLKNVTHVVSSEYGCRDTVQKLLDIYSPPSPNFTLENPSGCRPLKTNLINLAYLNVNNISNVQWDYTAGILDSNLNLVYDQAGEYEITLIVTDTNNCSDTSTQNIEVFELPTADFSPAPNAFIENSNSLKLENYSSEDAIEYTWSLGDNTYSEEYQVYHSYPDTGNYTVQLAVKNDNGCVDTIKKRVRIVPGEFIFLPNAFTPNADLVNDKFGPKYYNLQGMDYEFRIYNRWGKQVFYTENIEDKWDGNFEGKACDFGIYNWKLITSIKGKSELYTGTVTLLK